MTVTSFALYLKTDGTHALRVVGHFEGLARDRSANVGREIGVTVARFLSRQPASPWLAIHVFQTGGRTLFAVVPTPAGPTRVTIRCAPLEITSAR